MRSLSLISILLAAMPAWAQSTGALAGSVLAADGAAIPNAKLSALNNETGVNTSSETNEEGLYRFGSLTPGSYTLNVTQPGFAATKVTGIVIEVNRISRTDVVLQVAATQQVIEVSARAQLLDVESSSKGQVITAEQLRGLPLQTRNPLALLTLTPGVVAPAGGRSFNRQGSDGTVVSSNFSINGGTKNGAGGFQEYMLDGISITNQRDGSLSALPAADGLEEFRVQSGGMSADLGRTVGGVVLYVSRGGTNTLHGNLFEFHRSTATNARLAIPATASKPANVYNQFGGSVGGPVWIPKLYDGRNRTFWFFSYEGSRWVRNNPQLGSVPTDRMRRGDFGELTTPIYDPTTNANATLRDPFPNNIIPAARFNTIGKTILDKFPLPSRPALVSNVQGVFRVLTSVNNYSGRFDQAIGSRQRILARYTRVGSISDQNWPLGPSDARTAVVNFPSRNTAVSYVNTLSPSLLYTAAFGYTKFDRFLADPSGNTEGASFFGYSVNPVNSVAYTNVRPLASFDVYDSVGNSGAQNQIARTWQLNQGLSWSRSSHTIRVGADLRRYRSAGLLTAGASNGSFGFNALQTSRGTAATGNSAASLLLGLANTANFSQPPELALHKNIYTLYVQDDWKVSQRLTLSLGLRWDGEGGISEQDDKVGFFDTRTVNPLVNLPGVFRYAGIDGAPRSIVREQLSNFSPRVGLTYTPPGLRDTVIRAAFGVYNGPVPTAGYFAAAQGFEATLPFVSPGGGAPALVLRDRYELPAAGGPQGAAAGLGQAFTQPIDRGLLVPRIYQWNIGVQRQVASNTVAEVLYTANRGTRLFSNLGINFAPQSLIDQSIGLTNSTGNPTAAFNFLNERFPNPLAGKVPGTLGAATLTRAQLAAPYPHYAGISGWQNNRDSSYHALQATLQRRFSGDLSFLLSYTYSKQIENVAADAASANLGENVGAFQNPYNLRDARAVGANDRPSYFSSTVLYGLPLGRGKRWAQSGLSSALFGGFQINAIFLAHSGAPLAPQQTSTNGLGVGAARPDMLGDPVAASEAVRGRIASNGGVTWLDRNSFALVNGRYGNAPIRIAQLRGPSFWQADLGLQRAFKIYEQLTLNFRAEAFNAFNHTNLYNPVQNLNSPDFGVINQVHDSRIFQFGLELKF